MRRTFTLGRAVKEARTESEMSPSKIGMRQVSGGPAVNAYEDSDGALLFDIEGAGITFREITWIQAMRLSEVLFT